MKETGSALVYSTGRGLAARPSPSADGVVRVGRETAGRKGSGVTVITGLPAEKVEDLARWLKQKCGAGGTVRGRVIEIQGEHRDRIVAELQALHFTVKRSGG
jgi:translation initiation factor 1